LTVFEDFRKMCAKYAIFAVLGAFWFLMVNPASLAVSARDIEKVQMKGVLGDEDFQIIDNFVKEAVRDLVRTEDFTSIAKVRARILRRSKSSKESAQAQYSQHFSESALTHISEAFKQARGLKPEDRKLKTTLNLLILVGNLQDIRLVDLAIPMLKEPSTIIHYWAVYSITNPGITEQFNSTEPADLALAGRIIEQLKGLVDDSSPEITALMARFAAEVNVPQGEELLLQIAQMRMRRYADWTVNYELLDASILKFLYDKISSAGQSKAAIARSFGQLYSYTMQRYIKGRDFLSPEQKHQLASVLVEIENKCLWKLLGMTMRQTTIKRAVEQDDYNSLLQEHNRLLGDETSVGQLPLKLNFDYGTKPDGSKLTAPLALPERPKREVSG